ncbi:MAG: Ku protein [Deltaproteobacteria bacterium]|nr:MAG: Ku protein [Deltaproteobacteria bacterium]TMQ11606.1 MAG: Ku protein [Deltaproteobacteria bacterium]
MPCDAGAGVELDDAAPVLGAGRATVTGLLCKRTETSVTPGSLASGALGLLGPGAVDSPSIGPMGSTRCAAGRAHATQPAITAIHAPRSALEVMAHRAASRVPALSARSPACAGARSVRRGAGTAVATPDGMPARAIDTATLTFGLVAIPVKIYATGERSHEVHFHFVHEGCGERLHQQYVCARHGPVTRDEITRGYELTRGNFVELSRDELDALEAVASDEITIEEFVPAAAVDPLLIEHNYYLGPGKGGDRAYRLFADALADAELVAIASYAARGKQYIVELAPYQTGLAMHQLHYADEIKPWSEIPAPPRGKPAAAELALARKVIDNLRRDRFDPSRYKDEVKDRVRALIASKAKGGEITAPPSVERAPVTDLMAALKASLGAQSQSPHNGKGSHGSARSNGKGSHGGARGNGKGSHGDARGNGKVSRTKRRGPRVTNRQSAHAPAARSRPHPRRAASRSRAHR